MKKLLLFLLTIPMFALGYNLPSEADIPYQPMDIQSFFVQHGCFLADYKIEGMRPADIIRKCCYQADVNPKWVLARMQVERCGITGKVKGDKFIIPGHCKRLKIVLGEIAGFGLSWNYTYQYRDSHGKKHFIKTKLHPMKYVGFINQISHCASFMGTKLRTEGIYKTLQEYDPTKTPYDGVGLFCDTWKFLWPEDFR